SFGLFIKPEDVLNIGIQNLSDFDIQYAKEKGYKIKLVATAKKIDEKNITLFVIPQFVKPKGYLYNVENEYNAVIVEAAFSDTQFFMGKGAGGHPTGMAVLSDISALRYNYRYEYKRHLQHQELAYSTDIELEVYLRYTNDSILPKLGFTTITERFSGTQHNYVIGTLPLKNLIKNRAILDAEKAFVVNTGKINPVIAKKELKKELVKEKTTI
ncbi:MAG: homoserine dehydrogenase, partial [Bacteroidia bacterium]|nr:homoserine dehydrogenase [Bacteroidia bacterium]